MNIKQSSMKKELEEIIDKEMDKQHSYMNEAIKCFYTIVMQEYFPKAKPIPPNIPNLPSKIQALDLSNLDIMQFKTPNTYNQYESNTIEDPSIQEE